MPHSSHRRGFDEPDLGQPPGEVDQAANAAKFAALDLIGLMAAHGLDFPTLALLLEPGWPANVKRAYEEWVTRMDDVAKALAAQEGIPVGTRLSDKDREAFTGRAFAIVMDS